MTSLCSATELLFMRPSPQEAALRVTPRQARLSVCPSRANSNFDVR